MLTNSTEQSPCCETDSHSAGQEILFMETEDSLPCSKEPVILSYMNVVKTHPIY